MRIEIYPGHDGQWYWRAKSSNGRVIADGAEGYTRKRDARRAVWRFMALMDGDVRTVVEVAA